jgi:hypothetical protein
MWAPISKFHHGEPTTHLSVSISLDLNNPSVNDLLFPQTKEADRSEKGEIKPSRRKHKCRTAREAEKPLEHSRFPQTLASLNP